MVGGNRLTERETQAETAGGVQTGAGHPTLTLIRRNMALGTQVRCLGCIGPGEEVFVRRVGGHSYRVRFSMGAGVVLDGYKRTGMNYASLEVPQHRRCARAQEPKSPRVQATPPVGWSGRSLSFLDGIPGP